MDEIETDVDVDTATWTRRRGHGDVDMVETCSRACAPWEQPARDGKATRTARAHVVVDSSVVVPRWLGYILG